MATSEDEYAPDLLAVDFNTPEPYTALQVGDRVVIYQPDDTVRCDAHIAEIKPCYKKPMELCVVLKFKPIEGTWRNE